MTTRTIIAVIIILTLALAYFWVTSDSSMDVPPRTSDQTEESQ